MIQVVIGERKFTVREQLATDLTKLLDKGKRFWQWEEEITMLREMVDAKYAKEAGRPATPETLRDWFAGMAMQGFLFSLEALSGAASEAKRQKVPFLTEAAYEIADAMLAERSKK